ncbi:MAG: ankyrin repeat domain-containing protein [Candidatus Abyssobacteria bacterium SURF_5]|uniref:Ankyrin repeat domain-containing protein n=1 Tax=Abyssobacteria bacterium (strain SURF_5) TaxID=2093360 RepID=A0A3A4NUC2_ABYX5|nr:MAG: ankyrin repeat domain-containing protein [Candidatus Abyssubacteria bacterium SURF_5]
MDADLFFLINLLLWGLLPFVWMTKNPEKELRRWAAKGNSAKVKDLLRKRPFTFIINGKDANGMTPLMHAARQGHTDIVRLLVEKGAERKARNKCGETALDLALSQKHTEIVQYLKEFDPDEVGISS